MTVFSLLHIKPVIYQTKFPTYLFFNHFTHKIYYLPQKFINFFLVSPFQMVSPGAARPLRPRLSTPLLLSHPFSTSGHLSSHLLQKPRLWNDLPPDLRTFSLPPPSSLQIIKHHLQHAPLSVTVRAFHSKLTSHLFNLSFSDSPDSISSHSSSKLHPP